MRTFNIVSTEDAALEQQLRYKIDNLNKPKGSLGMLEELALQVGLIQQTLLPALHHPCHLLLGGDHGIEEQGVSKSPRCVTWQQMKNFAHGGGGVNMFCRQHGFKLYIVDMGVDHDLSDEPDIINRKIANGTQDFLYGPAMTMQQFSQAIETGCKLVDQCAADGCNVLGIGEMGIGNTSPSSILMSLLLDIPLFECIGAGSGLDEKGITHKRGILIKATQRFLDDSGVEDYALSQGHRESVEKAAAWFCGFEMAAAIGAMLRAAERRMVILVDGFIMSACMLVASKLYPEVMDYAVFCHCGDESGHRAMLNGMHAKPLLSLGMRLGEGTGALCAYPILESSIRMVNEMNNFDNAKITKYF